MTITQERRQHPRGRASLPVVIQTGKGVISTQTHNLSVGGAFIRCWEPLGREETFKLFIDVPYSKHRLIVDAEVVWVKAHRPDSSSIPRGMGVQFAQISSTDRKFLNGILARLAPHT